jgi:phospholipid/cholesterol/gamma-HCH transport system permease protein
MATRGYRQGDEHSPDGIYRCVGTLTITRAATTERELDVMPEGMTIDVSGITKMDTVGAWLIYRAVRDRGPKVTANIEDVAGLLEHV